MLILRWYSPGPPLNHLRSFLFKPIIITFPGGSKNANNQSEQYMVMTLIPTLIKKKKEIVLAVYQKLHVHFTQA